MKKLRIKKMNSHAKVPTYGTPYSAGADLYAGEEGTVMIMPNETKMISTGLAMEIPEGYVGLLFARSSLATKRGLAPANKVGVIDSDYRGEVKVALHNSSNSLQIIEENERIAQLIIMPYEQAQFIEAEDLEDTERGSGGFGSTGRL